MGDPSASARCGANAASSVVWHRIFGFSGQGWLPWFAKGSLSMTEKRWTCSEHACSTNSYAGLNNRHWQKFLRSLFRNLSFENWNYRSHVMRCSVFQVLLVPRLPLGIRFRPPISSLDTGKSSTVMDERAKLPGHSFALLLRSRNPDIQVESTPGLSS